MSCAVKITFGMIVLNGEPFIKYSLRALYPFAHQIIIAEGACVTAMDAATADGHSLDTTLQSIQEFVENEDPEGKVILVTAKDEGYDCGFWPEKDEMSIAYATRATGDYLWQVDSDEFYIEEDMKKLVSLMQNGVDVISFKERPFWGSTDIMVHSFKTRLQYNISGINRVFRWGEGYRYASHRPVTIIDDNGVDIKTKEWMSSRETASLGIFMYHYCLLFPFQVKSKVAYYSTRNDDRGCAGYLPGVDVWYKNYINLTNPYNVYYVQGGISWLETYNGRHPEQIGKLISDITDGAIHVDLRDNTDAYRFLSTPGYRVATSVINVFMSIISHPVVYPFTRACLALSSRLKSRAR